MKRILFTLAAFGGVIVASAILAAVAYPRFKRVEKRGPAPLVVSAVLNSGEESVGTTIAALFNDWSDFVAADRRGTYRNKFPYGSQWSHFFIFKKNDTERLFPRDEEILLDRGVDSFVRQYVAIDPKLRAHDVYFYEPSGDYYWPSEYFYQDRPAKFRCSFFIHLEPAGEGATKVEIFEYQPTVWVGDYVGVSAHAVLPAKLHDIRPVQATTADRQVILGLIEQAQTRAASP